MQQQTINTWETKPKTKICHVLWTGMQKTFIDGQRLKNYLLTTLSEKKTLKFDETFIRIYDENSDKGYLK